MNTEKLTNPRWWNEKHEGAWDRVKVALARDWEQTKAHFSSKAGSELDQNAGDTVRQAAGRQPIPPEGFPNPSKFEDLEPGMRFGYSAANEYEAEGDWSDQVEEKLKGEWDDLKSGRDWAQLKSAIKGGWQRARSQPLGEGSYEGTRRYNEHARDFARSGKVEPAADEARDAVNGKEKEQLEQAEAAGKRGPRH